MANTGMTGAPAGSPPATGRAASPLPGRSLDEFFRSVGDGVVVVFVLPDDAPPGSWLHIGDDSMVTAYTGKVEIGQNIRTSLAQAVAEELRVPMSAVRLVMGDTDHTPFDLGTFSSLTTRTVGVQLHRVAATARELLRRLAAEVWGVEPAAVTMAGAAASHAPTGRTTGYGRLVAGLRLIEPASKTAPLTPPSRWRVAGRSEAKVGARAYVTGEHRYPSDLVLPGMLVGKVLRPPAYDAVLASVDTRAAEAVDGARVVREGDFVGVAARDEHTATRALAALHARWSTTPAALDARSTTPAALDARSTTPAALDARPRTPAPSRAELFEYLRGHPVERTGRGGAFVHTTGSLAQGFGAATTMLRHTYTVDYVAHAPMEPRAAVARWADGRLTVWTATQRPFAVRKELAAAFGLETDAVRVVVPDAGSAFGGKHTGEAAIEAARLARATGAPVKLVWTRAEEFTWAYFRPAAVIDVSSGTGADGRLAAWELHCYNAGSDAIVPPYRIPHQHVRFHPARSPLRQGPYRALAATANHFARETHVDEIARALGADPLDFRRHNLADPRLAAVLEAAADRFGWAKTRPPGHGFGIAAGTEKGGYLATCVEVATDPANGQVRVVRVLEAFECGAVVNPGHLRAQIEGAVIQGLGGALFERVEFDGGRVTNAGFARYRVPRFADVPQVEAVLLDRPDLPSAGAGECPIVGIAPAVGNAIFDAAGVRLRSMPLVPDGLPAPSVGHVGVPRCVLGNEGRPRDGLPAAGKG